jgi:reticulon-4-interacting protein 1, mitochondrial
MPTSKKNEVLVKVVAAGLNPVDAKRVVGDKLPRSWKTLRSCFDRFYLHDKVPGLDFAGVVVQAPLAAEDRGTNNTISPTFRVGDRVFGMVPPFVGTLTDYLVAPVDQIVHVPPHLDWDRAAALALVGVTVVQVLEPLQPKDKSILVLGASGGTGHVALQAARAMGAQHVVAVCGDANVDFCRSCGATEVVSYQAGPQAMLERLLKGCGDACPFDVVLDCVTSDDPRDTSVHYPTLLQQSSTATVLLTPDYSYRRLGGPSTDWVRAGIERVTGWTGVWKSSHEKLFWIRLPNCSRELEQIVAWSGENGTPKVEPIVSSTFEFTQEGVTAAMSALMSRRVRGKVVVRIQSD